jgi:hypothetical protein
LQNRLRNFCGRTGGQNIPVNLAQNSQAFIGALQRFFGQLTLGDVLTDTGCANNVAGRITQQGVAKTDEAFRTAFGVYFVRASIVIFNQLPNRDFYTDTRTKYPCIRVFIRVGLFSFSQIVTLTSVNRIFIMGSNLAALQGI